MSGHLYYTEGLLDGCKADSENKSSRKSCKGYKPAFKYEDPADKAVLSSQAAESLHVFAFFDYQHRKASEYIECDDYDDKYEDHEYRSLLIFHHLVQGFVLLESVLYLESWSEPSAYFVLKSFELFFAGIFDKSYFYSRHLVIVFEQIPHFLDRHDDQFCINIIID